jgi:hypothetical protein
MIELIAPVLDEHDPEIQLSAAWILCEIAPGAPEPFEIYWAGHRPTLMEKYNRHVPEVRAWLKSRGRTRLAPSDREYQPKST